MIIFLLLNLVLLKNNIKLSNNAQIIDFKQYYPNQTYKNIIFGYFYEFINQTQYKNCENIIN